MPLELLRRLWFHIFDRLILYPLLQWLCPKLGITFMNLGYWPTENEEELIEHVEKYCQNPDKASYYLYEKPLSLHPEYPDLKGLTLLDVACGQGSGLKWIDRAHPLTRELVGLDAIPSKDSELTIVKGNAEKMPFNDGEFDIVLTVEASHLFNNCQAFFEQAYRVLKPGGHLCWIDLRYSHKEWLIRQQATLAGFTEVVFEQVTDQVLKGIEKTTVKYDRMLAKAPSLVHLFSSSLRATYCAPGTHTHDRLVTREKKYFVALWRK